MCGAVVQRVSDVVFAWTSVDGGEFGMHHRTVER